MAQSNTNDYDMKESSNESPKRTRESTHDEEKGWKKIGPRNSSNSPEHKKSKSGGGKLNKFQIPGFKGNRGSELFNTPHSRASRNSITGRGFSRYQEMVQRRAELRASQSHAIDDNDRNSTRKDELTRKPHSKSKTSNTNTKQSKNERPSSPEGKPRKMAKPEVTPDRKQALPLRNQDERQEQDTKDGNNDVSQTNDENTNAKEQDRGESNKPSSQMAEKPAEKTEESKDEESNKPDENKKSEENNQNKKEDNMNKEDKKKQGVWNGENKAITQGKIPRRMKIDNNTRVVEIAFDLEGILQRRTDENQRDKARSILYHILYRGRKVLGSPNFGIMPMKEAEGEKLPTIMYSADIPETISLEKVRKYLVHEDERKGSSFKKHLVNGRNSRWKIKINIKGGYTFDEFLHAYERSRTDPNIKTKFVTMKTASCQGENSYCIGYLVNSSEKQCMKRNELALGIEMDSNINIQYRNIPAIQNVIEDKWNKAREQGNGNRNIMFMWAPMAQCIYTDETDIHHRKKLIEKFNAKYGKQRDGQYPEFPDGTRMRFVPATQYVPVIERVRAQKFMEVQMVLNRSSGSFHLPVPDPGSLNTICQGQTKTIGSLILSILDDETGEPIFRHFSTRWAPNFADYGINVSTIDKMNKKALSVIECLPEILEEAFGKTVAYTYEKAKPKVKPTVTDAPVNASNITLDQDDRYLNGKATCLIEGMENLFKDEEKKNETTSKKGGDIPFTRPEDSIIKELGLRISGRESKDDNTVTTDGGTQRQVPIEGDMSTFAGTVEEETKVDQQETAEHKANEEKYDQDNEKENTEEQMEMDISDDDTIHTDNTKDQNEATSNTDSNIEKHESVAKKHNQYEDEFINYEADEGYRNASTESFASLKYGGPTLETDNEEEDESWLKRKKSIDWYADTDDDSDSEWDGISKPQMIPASVAKFRHKWGNLQEKMAKSTSVYSKLPIEDRMQTNPTELQCMDVDVTHILKMDKQIDSHKEAALMIRELFIGHCYDPETEDSGIRVMCGLHSEADMRAYAIRHEIPWTENLLHIPIRLILPTDWRVTRATFNNEIKAEIYSYFGDKLMKYVNDEYVRRRKESAVKKKNE